MCLSTLRLYLLTDTSILPTLLLLTPSFGYKANELWLSKACNSCYFYAHSFKGVIGHKLVSKLDLLTIKGSKRIAMNVGFGFYCKTLLYHPYQLLQKQKIDAWSLVQFVRFSEFRHFYSRVFKIEIRHLKQSHVIKLYNVREKSWTFEESIIKNIFERLPKPSLFLVHPVLTYNVWSPLK